MYLNFEGLERIEGVEGVEIFLVSPNEAGCTWPEKLVANIDLPV